MPLESVEDLVEVLEEDLDLGSVAAHVLVNEVDDLDAIEDHLPSIYVYLF